MRCFRYALDLLNRKINAQRNPDLRFIEVSAKTAHGMDQWYEWLKKSV